MDDWFWLQWLVVEGMRTASLEDKLLLNVIMKSLALVCNGARTRYNYKVGHSTVSYTIVAVGLSPPKAENTRGEKQPCSTVAWAPPTQE